MPFSSSIVLVLIASCEIFTLEAILQDSSVRYPLGSSSIPVGRIKSSNSLVGSFPVHSLSSGFFGKGGLSVPLPAFVPVLMNHVFRKRLWLKRSCLSP